MKLRTDFVTNSSSSSFIIATKLDVSPMSIDFIGPYVHKVAEAMGADYVALNLSELESLLTELFGDAHTWDKEETKIFNDAAAKLASGYMIYITELSWNEPEENIKGEIIHSFC